MAKEQKGRRREAYVGNYGTVCIVCDPPFIYGFDGDISVT